MTGKPRLNKYVTAMMTTALIAVPTFQALAAGTSNNVSNLTNSSAVETNLQGINAKASTGKHVITLITGDVVTVTEFADGQSVISVEPADKADGGSHIMTVNKDTYVIPKQAMPYLASGALDRNLFNITALIADGYDDASQKTLPVIVQYSESKTRSSLKPALKASTKTHELESINGAALSAEKKDSKEFWQDVKKNIKSADSTKSTKSLVTPGIDKIWLDGRVKATLEQSVPQIGAPTAWNAGYNGSGVKVAVLDTGIDAQHPDVAGQIKETKSFVPDQDVRDFHAHGTHVASTVLGTGAASGGKYKGVAPGASLIVGKVLSNEGFGLDSWIIDGMEWAAHNAKIVSMSLGSDESSDGTDPMAQAVNNLSAETGSLFVIAAGNTGREGIGSPGAADAALTVGAVDKSDNLAYFSSKGPRFGSEGLKPDLTAPGVNITAARSQYSTQGSGSYLSMSGTSMATPHVAGAAAILSQRHPDWTGAQLKDALMSTTKKLDDIKPLEGGTGRLDVAAATLGDLRATGSLDFGFYAWPHENDGLKEKTITYTNDSEKAVTLDLSAKITDNSDADAPAGLFKLSTNKVTVPAKGSAKVTVTLDPNVGANGQRYQGQISANVDGKTVVHTALAMIKEEERYPLTLNAIGRDGNPALAYINLLGPDGVPDFIAVNGTTELRLKPGTYSAMSMMDVDTDTDHAGVALVGDPEINLDGPQTVTLDARKANEITANVPNKTEASFRKMEYYREIDGSNVSDIYVMPVTVDKMYAEPTKKIKNGKFTFNTRWRLIEPYMTINFKGNELDDIPQAGSTLLDGKYNLDAVYVGKGSQADYKGLNVKGKAVIVDRSDEVTGMERSAAAYAAGAKLVITVNDGPEEISEYVGVENEDWSLSDSPIAVVAISKTEGKKLIDEAKAKKAKLDVVGTPNTKYVYDLVDNHDNAIPNDVTYSPKANDLVKINAEYKSDQATAGGEFRWDIPSYRPNGVGYQMKLNLPSVRTEWVSAQKGTSWYHQASVLDAAWDVRQPKATYKPGQTLDEEWFSPVARPRLGDGFWKPYRTGNNLVINIPAWADSGVGNTGSETYYPGSQTLKLYQGSKLVKEAKGQAIYSFNEYPTANTQYKVVSDAWRDPERFDNSVKTHTEWTFWSKEQEEYKTDLPLISLDYDVETDMNGDAKSGRWIDLEMKAIQVDGAPGNGKMKGATLEVSYDEGKSWELVDLNREKDSWKARIENRKNASSVSLRASAWDDAGNSINQDIIKAFGLK
ncbi:S8 family serine peptidase [Gottfriedia acidiceleris]|uniref:S8 family serine peptidase n=1 Tax=Gottfriedia acidiceleris TaxID=371036 RepID=UPI002FFFD06A